MTTPRPRGRIAWLLAALAIALLTACQVSTPNPDPDPDPTPSTGRIAGTLSGGATPGQLVAPRTDWSAGTATDAEGAPARSVLPGEVIVRFHDGVVATAAFATLTVDGVRLDAVRDLAIPGARLYRAPGIDAAATVALARRLSARPDVRYAQPNLVVRTFQTVPNDPLYGRQWHYDAIRLPEAWDVSTGDADVVVAVVDTGILHRIGDTAATHPDLRGGRVLQGYDFVDNLDASGDGTRRDPDPYDDDANGNFHGTHVAGTIGARTNDGVGVAGVDWSARLLPVRVLGVGGWGSLVDVIDGTLWAAGFSVSGVPDNTNPAHVINLSLGADAPCGPFEQEAFDRIATSSTRNAVVVVAAGNENAPVSGFSPASCGNVITVGATEQRDHRAPYSNFGPRIDVMAPGGDVTVDRDADGYVDGVLSLGRFGGGFGYTFLQGTSMAAPHVAGVVALMKAMEPSLTLEEARAFLVLTAAPLTAAECTGVASDCGAGLIDAAATLAALVGDVVPTPDDGAVVFSPDPIDFGVTTVERPMTLTNVGGSPVAWEVLVYDVLPGNPGAVPWGTVYVADGSPDEGTLAPGASVDLVLGINRAFLTAEGTYQIFLVFLVDGVEQGLTVRFQNGATAIPNPTGPTAVFAFKNVGGTLAFSGGQEAGSFFSTFDFAVTTGDHVVVGWTDQNLDGEVGAGDFLGTYPFWVQVTPGERATGVDIELERVLDVEAFLESAVPWSTPDAVRAALEGAGTALEAAGTAAAEAPVEAPAEAPVGTPAGAPVEDGE